MRLPSSRRLAILAFSLFALGCSDPLAPDDVDGLYVLQRIGSEALPATLFENECYALRVISEAILLRSNGTGTISGVQQTMSCQDGDTARVARWVEKPIRFQVVGGRIEIEFVCGPNELCIAPPHVVAHRTSAGLRATYFESTVPLHYSMAVFLE